MIGAWRPNARVDLSFAILLGALHSLPFVWLWLWPLQLLLIGLLVWRVAGASPRRAMGLGMAFGTGWVAAGTWWLYISMHRYGGLPALITVLAVVGLAASLSLYMGFAMLAFARWRRGGAWQEAVLFGALWLLAELARGVIFTGFPWVATGYAQVDSPFVGFAPWVGVYGIGFVVATASAWLALRAMALPRQGLRTAWQPLLGLALVLASGALLGRVEFTQPTSTLRVSLLQGNVPQEEKFEADHLPDSLAWTQAAMQGAKGDLVIGPETVIPVLFAQLDPEFWQDLTLPFTRGDRAALIGVPLGDMETGYTNSALGISPASAKAGAMPSATSSATSIAKASATSSVEAASESASGAATAPATRAADPSDYYRYDKHHLVPFGEFIPNGFHWFTRMMNIPLGDFNRGAVVQPSFQVRGERVAPNICYEDLFGEELAGRFVDAAQAPTIMANISNIGWFGDTIAIDQHLQISRMRTLELQRPMLRATNTGATVVIDHFGVVTAALPPYTQGVLEATVEGRSGITPFAWWAGRFDLWPLWLIGLALTLAMTVRRRASLPVTTAL